MKTISLILIGVVLTTSISSCKKDSTPPTNSPNFTQLKVGNYWIYERFNIDSSGNATATGIIDSCYIEKDTSINNITYYKFIRPEVIGSFNNYNFVRDSSHYLVNQIGGILFSSQNFTDTFYHNFITANPGDTICEAFLKMADKNFMVSCPAGQFKTYSYKHTFLMYPNWDSQGNPRHIDTRYAENIGIVTETFPFFASSPNYTQRQLIRYKVN
ncbi:MAG: hypothetical protein KA347_03420 [Bacteroidia bacterium]|jgi:hypothetical protein|nr:hypothetical protein [Bacteroidia bacterium]MBP7244794.1 hypothetical protein [Bacteroidia bacterium]